MLPRTLDSQNFPSISFHGRVLARTFGTQSSPPVLAASCSCERRSAPRIPYPSPSGARPRPSHQYSPSIAMRTRERSTPRALNISSHEHSAPRTPHPSLPTAASSREYSAPRAPTRPVNSHHSHPYPPRSAHLGTQNSHSFPSPSSRGRSVVRACPTRPRPRPRPFTNIRSPSMTASSPLGTQNSPHPSPSVTVSSRTRSPPRAPHPSPSATASFCERSAPRAPTCPIHGRVLPQTFDLPPVPVLVLNCGSRGRSALDLAPVPIYFHILPLPPVQGRIFPNVPWLRAPTNVRLQNPLPSPSTTASSHESSAPRAPHPSPPTAASSHERSAPRTPRRVLPTRNPTRARPRANVRHPKLPFRPYADP